MGFKINPLVASREQAAASCELLFGHSHLLELTRRPPPERTASASHLPSKPHARAAPRKTNSHIGFWLRGGLEELFSAFQPLLIKEGKMGVESTHPKMDVAQHPRCQLRGEGHCQVPVPLSGSWLCLGYQHKHSSGNISLLLPPTSGFMSPSCASSLHFFSYNIDYILLCFIVN